MNFFFRKKREHMSDCENGEVQWKYIKCISLDFLLERMCISKFCFTFLFFWMPCFTSHTRFWKIFFFCCCPLLLSFSLATTIMTSMRSWNLFFFTLSRKQVQVLRIYANYNFFYFRGGRYWDSYIYLNNIHIS